MNDWILIIFLFSPGGDYMDKYTREFATKPQCEAVRKSLPALDTGSLARHKGLCVTKDHWTGKKPMKGVPLD
jgi:hypothetical protein